MLQDNPSRYPDDLKHLALDAWEELKTERAAGGREQLWTTDVNNPANLDAQAEMAEQHGGNQIDIDAEAAPPMEPASAPPGTPGGPPLVDPLDPDSYPIPPEWTRPVTDNPVVGPILAGEGIVKFVFWAFVANEVFKRL
jgi:hypothetical protein